MPSDRHLWPGWIQHLRQWGVQDFAATTLEAAGPLTGLAAQALYFGQPFLRSLVPNHHLAALAGLLEEPAELHHFTALLREEKGL